MQKVWALGKGQALCLARKLVVRDMEYMAIWEAQNIGYIQSAEYIISWVLVLGLIGFLFYIAKEH